MAHTQGDWFVSSSFLVCADDGKVIVNTMPLHEGICVSTEEALSNAQAIALIPKLINMCIKAEEAFVSRDEDAMMNAQCLCTQIISQIKKEIV
jgi:hypothetical protein